MFIYLTLLLQLTEKKSDDACTFCHSIRLGLATDGLDYISAIL